MKKLFITSFLIVLCLSETFSQKSRDILYLKNGSTIKGVLYEVSDNKYKIRTADNSIFIFSDTSVSKFVKEDVLFQGRKTSGLTFSLEAGLLIGSQHSENSAPFSFCTELGYTWKTNNSVSLGSGLEFMGRTFVPLYLEYRYVFTEHKTSPFIFVRGGNLAYLSADEGYTDYYTTKEKRYKGGGMFTAGTGISWAGDNHETYLTFAYRHARTSYVQADYQNRDITYKNYYNRIEMKLGFRF